MTDLRHIGIGFGRIKRLEEGFGEFALQLSRRLAMRQAELRECSRAKLHFLMHKQLAGNEQISNNLNPKVRVHRNLQFYRFWHPSLTQYAVWHCISQLDSSLPPGRPNCSITTVHDLNFLYDENCHEVDHYMVKINRLLQRTQVVVAISDYVRQDVQKHLHWQGHIEVIHNGVTDLSQMPRQIVEGIDPSQPFLLHLSRLAPNKNASTLIEMAAIWPEMQFVLAGGSDRRHTAHLQYMVQEKQLQNVRFLLKVSIEQKAWLYANCSGFLFPSLSEGFGLPPIEAMYFGKPVFLSDRTALPEIGGAAAYYWTHFEPHSMKAVVERGLREARAPAVVEQIRAHAMKFSWDACAEAYLALYLRMLS